MKFLIFLHYLITLYNMFLHYLILSVLFFIYLRHLKFSETSGLFYPTSLLFVFLFSAWQKECFWVIWLVNDLKMARCIFINSRNKTSLLLTEMLNYQQINWITTFYQTLKGFGSYTELHIHKNSLEEILPCALFLFSMDEWFPPNNKANVSKGYLPWHMFTDLSPYIIWYKRSYMISH